MSCGKKEDYINSYEVERFIRQLTTLVWKKPDEAKKCEEVLLRAFAQRDAEINRLERELKKKVSHWPRIRELPEAEREPFRKWLEMHTCPLLVGLAPEEQDAYFPWDYLKWKE